MLHIKDAATLVLSMQNHHVKFQIKLNPIPHGVFWITHTLGGGGGRFYPPPINQSSFKRYGFEFRMLKQPFTVFEKM